MLRVREVTVRVSPDSGQSSPPGEHEQHEACADRTSVTLLLAVPAGSASLSLPPAEAADGRGIILVSELFFT